VYGLVARTAKRRPKCKAFSASALISFAGISKINFETKSFRAPQALNRLRKTKGMDCSTQAERTIIYSFDFRNPHRNSK
jgi:hypothetical protein